MGAKEDASMLSEVRDLLLSSELEDGYISLCLQLELVVNQHVLVEVDPVDS